MSAKLQQAVARCSSSHAPLRLAYYAAVAKLQFALCDSRDGWRIGALSLVDTSGPVVRPSSRMMVLRDVSLSSTTPRTISLSTNCDQRSPKVRQLEVEDGACWLFYDSHWKQQLRVSGSIRRVHETPETLSWDEVQPFARRCYVQNEAPSSVLPMIHHQHIPSATLQGGGRCPSPADRRSGSGWTLPHKGHAWTQEMTEHGRPNFARIQLDVHEMDWVWLDSGGHLRAKFWFDPGLGLDPDPESEAQGGGSGPTNGVRTDANMPCGGGSKSGVNSESNSEARIQAYQMAGGTEQLPLDVLASLGVSERGMRKELFGSVSAGMDGDGNDMVAVTCPRLMRAEWLAPQRDSEPPWCRNAID